MIKDQDFLVASIINIHFLATPNVSSISCIAFSFVDVSSFFVYSQAVSVWVAITVFIMNQISLCMAFLDTTCGTQFIDKTVL